MLWFLIVFRWAHSDRISGLFSKVSPLQMWILISISYIEQKITCTLRNFRRNTIYYDKIICGRIACKCVFSIHRPISLPCFCKWRKKSASEQKKNIENLKSANITSIKSTLKNLRRSSESHPEQNRSFSKTILSGEFTPLKKYTQNRRTDVAEVFLVVGLIFCRRLNKDDTQETTVSRWYDFTEIGARLVSLLPFSRFFVHFHFRIV